MPGSIFPLIDDLRSDAGHLREEMVEMLAARWELARLESDHAARQIKRLACVLCFAAVLATAGVTLLCLVLVEITAPRIGLTREAWLAIVAGSLLAFAFVAAIGGYLRFRRRFAGWQDSLSELREDAIWLRDWLGKSDADGDGLSSPR